MGENYSGANPFAPMKKAGQEEPDVYGAAEGTDKHEPWDVPDATPFSDPAPQRVDGGSHNAEWVTDGDKPTTRFSDADDSGDTKPVEGSDRNGEPLDADQNGVVDAAEGDDTEEVPNGTAKEVLDWVGDDEDRAQRALDVEEAKGEDARKGLTRDLQAKLED